MNKKVILIVVSLVIVLLCCCISTATAVFILTRSEEEASDDSEKKDNDDSVIDNDDTDNDDIGDDDSDDDSDNDDSDDDDDSDPNEIQPAFSEIKSNFLAVKAYRIDGELIFGQEKSFVHAEYQAPDKEWVEMEELMGVSEEIAVDDIIYRRAQGGVWEETEYPSLTGFHEDFIEEVFVTFFKDVKLEGEKDGYWKYSAVYNDADSQILVDLLVDKNTLYPYQMTVNEPSGSDAVFTFSKYNSSQIDIKAPI